MTKKQEEAYDFSRGRFTDYSLFDRYDRFSFSFNVLAQKMEMANIDIGLLWNVIYAVEDMLYCENKPPKSSTIFSTIIPEKNRKE